MIKPISLKPEVPVLGTLILLLIFSSGCSLSPAYLLHRADRYYLIDIPQCKLTTQTTDATIVECKEIVRSILRERFNNARLARTTGGAIQVLTAAVSSMLTGINGASALTAATILSGTSSIMPELSNVIEAKDRAEVYSEGLKAIESAEARFLKAIAGKPDGKIDANKVTPDGAELYDTVFAAVHVVEARLAALLPSVQELQKLQAVSETIGVAPAIVSLKPEVSGTVQVIHGGPISIASSDRPDTSVEPVPGGMAATIKPAPKMDYGWATITLTNNRGGTGTVTVRVEKEPFVINPTQVEVQVGKDAPPVTVEKGGPIKDTRWIGDADVADVQLRINPSTQKAEVIVKGKKEGNPTLELRNWSDRVLTVKVVVKP